jgi:hypothetical protein
MRNVVDPRLVVEHVSRVAVAVERTLWSATWHPASSETTDQHLPRSGVSSTNLGMSTEARWLRPHRSGQSDVRTGLNPRHHPVSGRERASAPSATQLW